MLALRTPIEVPSDRWGAYAGAKTMNWQPGRKAFQRSRELPLVASIIDWSYLPINLCGLFRWISFAILDPLEALCSTTIALVPEGIVFLGIYSMLDDLNYLDIHRE